MTRPHADSSLPDRPRAVIGTEYVARRMFERQAATYDADTAMTELAWTDDAIREFWLAEAVAVLDDIEAAGAEP